MSSSPPKDGTVVLVTTPSPSTSTPPTPVKKVQKMPNSIQFLFGGLSGMGATCFVQPLDLIKNRIQLSGSADGVPKRSLVQVVRQIISTEGFFALYNGLSAGLLRQATYTTTRLGVYNALMQRYNKGVDPVTGKDQPLPFWQKALIGMAAGGIGALVGNPAEISLIRMTADGRLPPAERRNYSSVFDALRRMVKEEGITRLWRGSEPTVIRAMVINAAQLASYSQAKQYLLSSGFFKDNLICHFTASLISGFIATLVSMPVDLAKTRIQNMKHNEYRHVGDVWMQAVKKEGVFSLWKGFLPYFLRLGPHTIITFILLEQMNKFYFWSRG